MAALATSPLFSTTMAPASPFTGGVSKSTQHAALNLEPANYSSNQLAHVQCKAGSSFRLHQKRVLSCGLSILKGTPCSANFIQYGRFAVRRNFQHGAGLSYPSHFREVAAAQPSSKGLGKKHELQSSFTGRQGVGYLALSSGLASYAAWDSFGAYRSLSNRAVLYTGRRSLTLMGRESFGGLMDSLAGALGAVLLAFVLAICSFAFVPSGSVGIRTTFGQVESQALHPGLHFTYPLVSRIENLTTKTQLIVADESDVPTKEGLVVELDVSILHSLDPAKAGDLYITVGPDYVNRVILPELHSAVANITSEYHAKALYTNARAELTQKLTLYLQQKLAHKGIVIEDVLLRAIKLPEQLTQAIQDKLQTEQEAQRMEFVLLKEQQEAERKRIEAEGIATFQKIVSEGISPQLLQWKGIEATQELAKSPNSKVVVIGNAKDGLPIILGGDDSIAGKRRK